ncbi:MAG TPA: glutamine synthetase [Pseudomonas sp.]|uniref:glutamine synthetase n=1 Tax=Pseudomonas sp. TaxID=306 RepID=UPI002EDB3805
MRHVFDFVSVLLLLMAASTQVVAAPPSIRAEQALCTRSALLLACLDAYGNSYSVAMSGTTMFMRGYEAPGNRWWAQTNSRYGQLTFFTGVASDGEVWVGWVRRVGWTSVTRLSSSNGAHSKVTCDRLMGCR